jgi:hypothetical protein
MYCKNSPRGTGSEIIMAATKNARYVIVFFTMLRAEPIIMLVLNFVVGSRDDCGAMNGSKPPVTMGANVVDCGSDGF